MRFLTLAAAFSRLTVMGCAFLVVAGNDSHAQTGQMKPASSDALATHGMAPADALARALQQREAARKRQALQNRELADTRKMFLQRQSVLDQIQNLRRADTKAKDDIIRRLQN
jgi:hypothetical protein